MPNPQVSPLRRGQIPLPKQSDGVSAVAAVRRRVIGQRQADLTSALGAGLCLAAALSLALGAPLGAAAILFPLGALCDLADGRIARASRRQESPQVGVFIDSICDKVGELALWGGLAIFVREDVVQLSLVMAAFGFGMATSLVKAFAEVSNFALAWGEARVFGRAGRAVLISATLVFAAVLSDRSNEVFAVGLSALLAFNLASFARRAVRVAPHVVGWERHRA